MSILTHHSPVRPGINQHLPRFLQRLAGGIIVFLASATITFFALKLTPVDPVRALLDGPLCQPHGGNPRRYDSGIWSRHARV